MSPVSARPTAVSQLPATARCPITDFGPLGADIYTNVTLGGGETVAFTFTVTTRDLRF